MTARPLPVGGALIGVAVLPIAIAAIRALARGWTAIGDNGLILLRAEDVGTAHHPLLGTWTSASITAGRAISNPGPLWFDILAPFVKVAGPSVGLVIGVATANAAAVIGAAMAARRVAGLTGLAVVTLLSAGLAWTMGSELLFDAWQPHAMVLPFWCLLVIAWAVASGDHALIPWMAGVASLIVQTHLSFVYVTATAVLAALALWFFPRRDRRSVSPAGSLPGAALTVPDGPRRDRRSVSSAGSLPGAALTVPAGASRRALGWTIAVVAVAWSQPVIDQVAGTGNLGALLSSAGSDAQPVGLRLGARFVASVVAFPPWWGRPGFTDTIRATGTVETGGGLDVAEGDVVGIWAAIVGLVVVFLLLSTVIVLARRRADRPVLAVAAIAGVVVATAVVSMRLVPVGAVGLSPHTMRWLWPISALVLVALVLPAVTWTPARRVAVPVAAALTVVVSLLTLPTSAAQLGPTADRAAMPTVAALVDAVGEYEPDGPVIFDISTLRFAEPYSGPVIAAMAREGIDVVVTDDGMVRQLGEGRRADGDEQRRVVLIEGAEVRSPPAGARPVAVVNGLTSAERDELDRVRRSAIELASRDGLELNDAGLDAAEAGRIPFSTVVLAPGGDAAELDALGWIGALVSAELVELSSDQANVLPRYAELEQRAATATVGLFELPVER